MARKDKYIFNPLSYLDNLNTKTAEDKYVKFMRDEIASFPSIRNIGVIGPYGSGKSSVVHTFLNNEESDYKYTLFFSQETIAEHLAKNNEKEDFHMIVKKAIYLELLKYDTGSILLKDYNESLLYAKKWRTRVACAAFAIVAVCLSIALFIFLSKVINWNCYISALLSFALFNLFAAIFFALYIKAISFTLKVKNAETKAELGCIRDYNDISEQINNHPTELDNLILYIIKQNKIRYFVIEDMERLNKNAKGNTFEVNQSEKYDVVLEIIKQFKILSDLINRSKIVKTPVRFIYGLNDECFKDSEVRSKFFDLIVPVIPLATYSSAGEAICDDPFVKELIDDNELKESTINRISLYFKNQRQINAFLSQFYLNCEKLSRSKMYNEIFAITSLAVLFPHFSHSLYEKNNSLDILLNEEWTISDNKIVFTSGRELPKDLENEKNSNLALFLKMCIDSKLITKYYRMLLTIHKVANDNIVFEKDAELLMKFYSNIDIRKEKFEKPDNLLDRLEDEDFIGKPSNFHPQLFDCMVSQNDNRKLEIFKDLVSTMEEAKRIVFLLRLVDDCNENSVEYIIKTFNSQLYIYNIVSRVRTGRNNDYALLLIQNAAPDFLTRNKGNLVQFFNFINETKFIDEQKTNLTVKDMDKLINSGGFTAKDLSNFSDKKDILELFKNNPRFIINFKNLNTLFPTFKIEPFVILNKNAEICNEFLKSPSCQEILENCEIEKDPDEFAIFFSNHSSNRNIDVLLKSRYFDPWRFKLTVNHSHPNSSMVDPSIEMMLNNDLLDLNNAYSMWYSTRNPSAFFNRIKENSARMKEFNAEIKADLSYALFKNLNESQLVNIASLLDYSFVTENVSSFNVSKIIALIDFIDEENAKELLVKAATENESLFNTICEKRIIPIENAEKIALNRNEIINILDKNLKDYYPLVLTKSNFDVFSKIVKDSDAKKDYARLIFLEDGTLRTPINPSSLVEVCKYEMDNKGALEKVFNQVDEDTLKNNCWLDFIEYYVEKYGSQERAVKNSLHNNELNSLIYNRLISANHISAAKGQSKNRLYFTYNK